MKVLLVQVLLNQYLLSDLRGSFETNLLQKLNLLSWLYENVDFS